MKPCVNWRDMTDTRTQVSPDGVTAVVCCHNSAGVIVPAMKALAGQRLPPGCGFELILVDNACTDATVELARQAAADTGVEIRVISEPKLGLIHARLAGVRAAKFEITLFVDDDNILDLDYVEGLFGIFQNCPDVGAVGGYAVPCIRGSVPEWFLQYQMMFACGPQEERTGRLEGNKQYLYGAGLSFRTQVLRKIMLGDLAPILTGRKGEQLLRGDDTELCYRCHLSGWRLYYAQELRLRHNIDSRRISWRNACMMRRQSGVTWMLLNTYARISLGRKPPSLSYMRALLVYRWLRLCINPWSLARIGVEGSASALRLQFLIGMARCALFMGPQYLRARLAIMEHFSGAAQD